MCAIKPFSMVYNGYMRLAIAIFILSWFLSTGFYTLRMKKGLEDKFGNKVKKVA